MVLTRSLLDRFQECIATCSGIMGLDRRNGIGDVRKRRAMLDLLARARCFRLSQAFTRDAALRSMREPAYVLRLLRQSRPPYDVMWIEFDETVRGAAQAKLDSRQAIDWDILNSGYLIERDPHDGHIYHVSVVFETAQAIHRTLHTMPKDVQDMAAIDRDRLMRLLDANRFGAALPGFAVSTSILPLPQPVSLAAAMKGPVWTRVPSSSLDGDIVLGNFLQVASGSRRQKLELHRDIADINRARSIELFLLSRIWVNMHMKQARQDIATLACHITMETSRVSQLVDPSLIHDNPSVSWSGMLPAIEADPRYVSCVLGLMNEHEMEFTPLRPAAAGRSYRSPVTGQRRELPFLDQHELSIVAPAPVTQAQVQPVTQAQAQAHRRLHEVRGHWAVRRKDISAHQKLCTHDWQDTGCLNCGLRRWWKTDHQRGDAEVGVVEKRYVVKPRRSDDTKT